MHRVSFGRSRCGSKVRRLRLLELERMEPRALLASFTVVSAADSGDGSLRWAILQANLDTTASSIVFDIPGTGVQTIAIKSPLPVVTNPVAIDGTSQHDFAGALLIQLDGTGAGQGADGLVISAGSSVVKGLAIGGFGGAGIVLRGGGGDVIQGNKLGTDPTGTSARPNGYGLRIVGSSQNTIGGTSAGTGNQISGNAAGGISIEIGPQNADAAANLVVGNLVGTADDGNGALGNQGDGIAIRGATGNTLGGADQGAGNVLSGNLNGINLNSAARQTLVLRNLIGTTADGLHALGNRRDGILLDGASTNVIGGALAGAANVIGGNQGHGIETAHGASGNAIVGNFIGTDLQGKLRLGNQGNGVTLGSGGNTVGGQSSGDGNTIAFNGAGLIGAGVQLSGLVDHDSILSNSIHDNAGLGINLGNGPTPNHPAGSGQGPNDNVNYPVFSTVQTDGVTTSLQGILTGQPGAAYLVQVFSSPAPDPSGYGEGQTLIGSFQTTLGSGGRGTIAASLPPAGPGSYLSATATDAAGNTSEFSPDVPARAATDLRVTIAASPNPVGVGGTLTYSVKVTNQGVLDAHHVVLSDTLPGLVTVASATSSQGPAPSIVGPMVTAAIGTVPGGGSATLTITIPLTSQNPVGQTLVDSAAATLDEIDTNPADNTASATTTVRNTSGLSVSLTPVSSSIPAGQPLACTLVVANAGPADEPDAILSVPLPTGVTLLSCSAPPGATVAQGASLAVDLGKVPAGTTAQVVVRLTPGAGAIGPLTLSASLQCQNVNTDPAGGLASATVAVTPAAGLAIAIRPRSGAVYQSQDLAYTLQVTNNGPTDDPNVVVTAPLPAGVDLVSATGPGSPPVFQSGVVTAAIGTLPVGQTASVTIVVRPSLAAPAPGITLAASVVGDAFDPDPQNGSASVAVPVQPSVDLGVVLAGSQASGGGGQPVTLTATVANAGPSPATGVVFRLPIGAGVAFVSARSGAGSTSLQSGTLLVSLGSLPPGASTTVTVTLSPLSSGPLDFAADVTGDEFDLDVADNHATLSVQADGPPESIAFASPLVSVPENAGFAAVQVLRAFGSEGSVSVHYQTAGGNATPGVDYQPVSGTLTFAGGETAKIILVPVMANPHDNHDEYFAVTLDSPSRPAVLGSVTSTVVQVRDVDPDTTPPRVASLSFTGTAASITSLVVRFSEPVALDASSQGAFQLADLGTSGSPTAAGSPLALSSVTAAGPNADTVTLVPTAPLVAGHSYRIVASGTGAAALRDLAGNPLAGAGAGLGGTDYVALFSRGTTIKYVDDSGNAVTLKVTGGGYLDDIRGPRGDGQVLVLEDPVAHKTTLSGTVVRPGGRGAGTTSLGTIEGLGQFGDVRVTLTSRNFTVRQLPFALGRGRPATTARPAPPAKKVPSPHPIHRRPVPQPVTRRK